MSSQRASGDERVTRHRGWTSRGDLEIVFDQSYYEAQAGESLSSRHVALDHYLETGASAGYDPHLLFDTSFYVRQVDVGDANPLIHFLDVGARSGLDPSPYFDVAHYYAQLPSLKEHGLNPLVHYITYGPGLRACNPNAVFSDGFYATLYRDVGARGEAPLAHYLRTGWRTCRWISEVHRQAFESLIGIRRRPLLRAARERPLVLFIVSADAADVALAAHEDPDASDVETAIVLVTAPDPSGLARRPNVTVLADHIDAAQLTPAAVRLLARSLAATGPSAAVTDLIDVVEPLRAAGARTYGLVTPVAKDRVGEWSDVEADRLVFTWPGPFPRTPLHRYPTRVAVRPYRDANGTFDVTTAARTLLDLIRRDWTPGHDRQRRGAFRQSAVTRRVLVPCCDWWVSGVNTALEGIGRELMDRGWELEILFTRDPATVIESAGDGTRLPALPYRILGGNYGGPEGLWGALIDELTSNVPCVMLMAYDFVANAVAAALPDEVGCVMWAQADDTDYYEQAYRLGRYCNAVVCVSDRIRENICSLNPALEDRAYVVHNSSVWQTDVLATKDFSPDTLTIAYAGRLVQYQKRVLDYVELADALQRLGVPFAIRLIGRFPVHEPALERRFLDRAARHVQAGRIQLLGRLGQDEILEELARSDFFVLLSDFEGFPLGLVEAMARGCVPVVAEMESGVTEIVDPGRNGFVVRGRDYDEWARVLRNAWTDRDLLAAMSARARAVVRDRFALEHTASQFDMVLQRVAREVTDRTYSRPPSLNWGQERSPTGDVLPPPFMYTTSQAWGID